MYYYGRNNFWSLESDSVVAQSKSCTSWTILIISKIPPQIQSRSSVSWINYIQDDIVLCTQHYVSLIPDWWTLENIHHSSHLPRDNSGRLPPQLQGHHHHIRLNCVKLNNFLIYLIWITHQLALPLCKHHRQRSCTPRNQWKSGGRHKFPHWG